MSRDFRKPRLHDIIQHDYQRTHYSVHLSVLIDRTTTLIVVAGTTGLLGVIIEGRTGMW